LTEFAKKGSKYVFGPGAENPVTSLSVATTARVTYFTAPENSIFIQQLIRCCLIVLKTALHHEIDSYF